MDVLSITKEVAAWLEERDDVAEAHITDTTPDTVTLRFTTQGGIHYALVLEHLPEK